ncbi:SusC/RagA family TonB-linked outer membrane protein [Ekhidna sp.]|uniref:SusC/RagA family TonB-linked outer membrane protein n=1 Tax=Ekhidna sp. TaxID=2608089 RepID=UPI003B5C4754
MKKFFFSMMACLLVMAYAHAQRTVSGKVTDDTGEPLIGVNVVIKGTTSGTTTDIDGNYRVQVNDDDVLVYSFVGFDTQEINVGTRTVIDVTMGGATELQEVVVTAFGIEKERKELGYAVTTVDGDELTKARSSNVLQSLSGRVPGVRINSSSGTAGGSVNIQIRGASSISGTSQPLFIVDGTPISNSSFRGTRNETINGGADTGNRASDLNPDDIESMTVLKGASAVALYGQRARDGVVIVTTKKGKGALKLDVNSSVRVSKPFVLPDLQNEYASGDFGTYNTDAFSNGWGPRIDGLQGESFRQFPYDGNEGPLVAQPDNVKDFFETGTTLINNFAISQSTDAGDFRLSYTNFNEKGIVPNNELTRHSFSLNAGTTITKKLSTRAVVNYSRTEGVGRPRQGSNTPTRVISSVYNLQRTHNIDVLKNNLRDADGVPIGIDGNQTGNNPYWIVNETPFNNQVDRVFGNFSLNYRPVEWLDVTSRVGLDMFTETRRNITAKGTKSAQAGSFEDRDIYRREMTYDLFARATYDINSDLVLTALVGYQVNQINNEQTRAFASNLIVADLYTPSNALSVANTRFESIRRLFGVYTDIGFGYKDYLFLNITGRNDWSSTLPKANNSFFYPGVSSSFIFSEAFDLPDFISYGKFRASYAIVGSDELPYQLDFLFLPQAEVFTQFLPNNNTFPHGGQGGFGGPATLPAGQSLEPQDQATFEVGTEVQFFGGRVGFDATYYETVTSNQILSIQVAQSTGFDAVRQNAGEVTNSGIELSVFGSPVKNETFEWRVTANFSNNKQEVTKLAPGLEDLALTSGFSGLSIRAEEGEQFGLYGAGWDRSPDGDIIINATTGERERGGRARLGNINPDYQLGIMNTVTYKNFTVSALVDISKGGVLWSGTVGGIRGSGVAAETAENRGRVFIDNGVNRIDNGDGTFSYVENQTPVRSMQDFWNTYTNGSNTEGSVFDASYVKLREVTISYRIPNGLLSGTPLKAASIGFEARNLWLIDSEVPHIDPEASFFGPGLIGGQANVEFYNVPSSTTFGANVRLTF